MSQKKGKKKGRRKDDDWEDEVTNELEQMQLNDNKDTANKNDHVENNDDVTDKIKKKKKKGKKGKEDEDSEENVPNKNEGSKSAFGLLDVEDVDEDNWDDKTDDQGELKKEKRTKKESLDKDNEITGEDNDITAISKTEQNKDTKGNSDDEDEFDFKKEKRKGKKGKSKKVDNEIEEDNLEEEPTMKTAAQKRAEKKERERKKKEAQKKKVKDGKPNKMETEKNEEVEDETLEEVPVAESSKNTEVEPVVENKGDESVKGGEQGEDRAVDEGATGTKENEKEEGEEGEEKKKKKKKKKEKEKEAIKTKKPARGVIKQMQEALEKAKQEQERLRQEEEAKQKALEEAENRRLEKIRLEKERKEKQKKKEKERKLRLKQEGKLLTSAQKQQRAQNEAMLQAMREQGIAIPKRSDTGQNDLKKPVRYGKKKPKPVKEKSEVIEAEQETAVVEAPIEDQKDDGQRQEDVKTDLETKDIEIVEETEEVKDTWEDDEELQQEDDIEINTANQEKEHVAEDIEESSEDTEEENDEDEEDEEEEEDEDEESDEGDSLTKEEREFARAKARIEKRREKAEAERTKDKLRSPVICVMGHVDTGKTKILDKIRHSNVQDGEAGGITQQIGATNVPREAIGQQTKMIKDFCELEMKIPALLIIDTPGHESFSNLRSRGSTLCDMAILVVDIMHGLEPQTIESINLLRKKKTPFVVALNKIDRLFEWKRGPNSSIVDTLKKQNRNTKQEFEERLNNIIAEFAAEGLNAVLFHKNVDTKTYISLVPTSAHSGDGMGDLIALIVTLCQTKLAHRLSFSEELQCTVLEVKAITGLGTTVDVILTNGRLAETQTIVLGGIDGPIVTQVRALLMPQPLKELRVKNQYATFKEIEAAQGVKITGKELDKALAGSPLFVAYQEDEVEVLKKEVAHIVNQSLKAIKVSERGVCVQASTLGSLEALLEFLKSSKIPYCSVSVGPVHKKDVMKASVMLEHDTMFAVLLAFDVKVERDAQELADSLGVKIFTADIIYHLFDKFTNYREELKQKKRDEFKHIAIFPCKLRILPEHIFNSRDPIVVGVSVEAGVVKEGTPICVPSKEFVDAGIVTGIEANHKQIEKATKGMEVCVKIEPIPGEAPKMYGRHFDYTDLLVSKVSRESIDAVKEYFRDDLQKSDWQLMIELKKLFGII